MNMEYRTAPTRVLGILRIAIATAVVVGVIGPLTEQNLKVVSATTVLVNPSFESGSLAGWDVVLPPFSAANATTSFGPYTAQHGTYFALLKTDGPNAFTTISQGFSALANDTIKGWAFFLSTDRFPINDHAEVVIKSGNQVIASVFAASVSSVGALGQTPWTPWEFRFPSSGTYTIEARITNDVDSAFPSFIGLDLVVPIASANGPYMVFEGGSVTLAGSAGVPSIDPLVFAWDLNNDGIFETPGQTPIFSAAGRDGPSSQQVLLRVCNGTSLCTISSATVNIVNAVPVIGSIITPPEPILVNTVVSFSATFTDPGVPDTHTVVWHWGDGSSSTGTLVEANGFGVASNSHSYTAIGSHTMRLFIQDDDGGLSQAVVQVSVISQATVTIDIKPGSDPNSYGCKAANGALPVAILSAPNFDATTVEIDSVRFGKTGSEAAEVHRDQNGKARRHLEDVNGDLKMDLVLHFSLANTGFSCADMPAGQNSVTLTSRLTGTSGGMSIVGEDSLRLTGG